MKLYWKDVFNSDHKKWGWIGYVQAQAIDSGYSYFTWNGWVYSCTEFFCDKVCKVEELI